jgi:hypothetical protein
MDGPGKQSRDRVVFVTIYWQEPDLDLENPIPDSENRPSRFGPVFSGLPMSNRETALIANNSTYRIVAFLPTKYLDGCTRK